MSSLSLPNPDTTAPTRSSSGISTWSPLPLWEVADANVLTVWETATAQVLHVFILYSNFIVFFDTRSFASVFASVQFHRLVCPQVRHQLISCEADQASHQTSVECLVALSGSQLAAGDHAGVVHIFQWTTGDRLFTSSPCPSAAPLGGS
jgi:hypothetical protein